MPDRCVVLFLDHPTFSPMHLTSLCQYSGNAMIYIASGNILATILNISRFLHTNPHIVAWHGSYPMNEIRYTRKSILEPFFSTYLHYILTTASTFQKTGLIFNSILQCIFGKQSFTFLYTVSHFSRVFQRKDFLNMLLYESFMCLSSDQLSHSITMAF